MRREFIQGYVAAISNMVRYHGESTAAEEALRDCGLDSIKILRQAGVEDYDIGVLRNLLKSIKSRQRRMLMKAEQIPTGEK